MSDHADADARILDGYDRFDYSARHSKAMMAARPNRIQDDYAMCAAEMPLGNEKEKKEISLMPIYEYECRECGAKFEKLTFAGDSDFPCCPRCDCKNVSKLMSAGCVRPQGIPKGAGGFSPPPKSCNPGGG